MSPPNVGALFLRPLFGETPQFQGLKKKNMLGVGKPGQVVETEEPYSAYQLPDWFSLKKALWNLRDGATVHEKSGAQRHKASFGKVDPNKCEGVDPK